ncbi:DUF3502 domain-containing protein [Paenibacillus sp. LMG 31458]|uniref:DUF3502 domain-containing protein n=1 Tax=Paenibacillus phytorum TaxID=2654977 RepID=A0ABX1XWX6_9BACL|nr:DUF3502 domain-containing protein [Paenibacillus phytorum]NOU73027.1 DUF3502 domain-containing protein [Paenibacillus phytorum]
MIDLGNYDQKMNLMIASDGKLYGVINYQIMATSYGFDVQKELADKYHFDWKNAKTYYLILWKTENVASDAAEKWDQLNKTSDLSPILGFTFNTEAVKSEIAQCQAVIDQYLSALTTGTADPDKIQY